MERNAKEEEGQRFWYGTIIERSRGMLGVLEMKKKKKCKDR